MPFTETIVKFINDCLKAGSLKDKKFQPGSYNCLASVVARKKDDGSLELLPAIADADGNYQPVQPDDRFNLIIYHKTISNAYSYVKNDSYGDGYLIKSTTENNLIAWIDSRKTFVAKDQFETLIIAGFPQIITKEMKMQLMIQSCIITPISSNMDILSVFRAEYQNCDFFLKPYHGLFAVRYRIEITFNQACLDTCK